MPVSIYLRSSCNHVRRTVRFACHALKVVTQYDRDVMDVILLYSFCIAHIIHVTSPSLRGFTQQWLLYVESG